MTCAVDPLAVLATDRARARALGDPLADLCFLATVAADGAPAVRTLVLRDIREGRLTLFLHRTSPKWQELQSGNGYQLLLFYPTLGRQYRLSGDFEEIADERLAPHLAQRPPLLQALDRFYSEVLPQSATVASRGWLLEELERMRVPPDPARSAAAHSAATGIDCRIERIDLLDIATPSGVHERSRYLRAGDGWIEESLVP